MGDLILGLIAIVGLVLGAATARRSAPLACTWPSLSSSVMRQRITALTVRPPSWRRRWVAGGALVLLLGGGVLGAYAAAPSAPDQLPGEVRGVVGSGDQLSLQVKTDGGADRTIKLGDIYKDGWALQGLTNSQATLVKDGQTRQVGLNPSGALATAAPTDDPTLVRTTGLLSQATIEHYLAMSDTRLPRARTLPMAGLSDAERDRWLTYTMMNYEAVDQRRAEIAAGTRTGIPGLDDAGMRALLGDAEFEDKQALGAKFLAAVHANQAAALVGRPVTGPTSYYVPAGANESQIVAAEGIDTRGLWQAGPADAQGGRTMSLVAGTAEGFTAALAAGVTPRPTPPPLPPPPPPPPPTAGF